MTARQRRPERKNSITYEAWLAVLGLVSVAIGINDLRHPRHSRGLRGWDWLDLAIVGVFIADFVREARRRGSYRVYARENWWELPSLLPMTGAIAVQLEAFPLIRAIRLVRFVRFLRLLRIAGIMARFRSNGSVLARVAARAQLVQLASVAVAIVGAGSMAGYLLERHVNDHMSRYGGALWWALNIFTNVAYIDFQPVTAGGHVIAGVLEFLGMGFIGVFAASLTSALIRERRSAAGPD